MKIHEKILTHFQSCNSPVDKEGYLYKKGERNTSYQKRWFSLKGNLLFYKDRPGDRDLLGVVVLEGCSVQLCESEEQFCFSLVWSEPGLRTYKLAAEDQPGQEGWIRALSLANHQYLRLLVMDLEKQYMEAIKAFPTGPSRLSSTLPRCTQYPGPASGTCPGPAQLPQLPQRPAQLLQLPQCPAQLPQRPAQLLQLPQRPAQLPQLQPTIGCSTNLMLHVAPMPSKPAPKKSPKLWPKRNANVVPVSGPAPPQGEWSVIRAELKQEFNELHEDFGKEIRELIADWLRRGRDDVVQEEDLIDFG